MSLTQHAEQEVETTSFPLSATADWLEDANDTIGNQFQQPDWQVGKYGVRYYTGLSHVDSSVLLVEIGRPIKHTRKMLTE